MSFASLDQSRTRVLMFGGKGGVGKTTISAATVMHYARAGRRTLINSLQPPFQTVYDP